MLPAENGRREEKGHWSPTQELKVQLCSEIEQSSKTEHSFKMIILTTYVSTHVPDLLRTDGEVMVSWITLKDGLLGHSRARKRRTFFIFTGGAMACAQGHSGLLSKFHLQKLVRRSPQTQLNPDELNST